MESEEISASAASTPAATSVKMRKRRPFATHDSPSPRATTKTPANIDNQREKDMNDDEDEHAERTKTEVVQHIVQTVQRSLQDSLNHALCRIGQEYGVETMPLVPASTSSSISDEMRVLLQELQATRQRESAFQSLVKDLQAEQKVLKEKVGLYSVLVAKLKRSWMDEKLAHIDAKKEIAILQKEMTTKASPLSIAASPTAAVSPLEPKQQAQETTKAKNEKEENDPWHSPDKNTRDPRLLSFGSFYSSHEDRDTRLSQELDDDVDEPSSPQQSLRSSLIGQYLPSMLLDSPQQQEHRQSFGEHSSDHGTTNDTTQQEDQVPTMEPFALSGRACGNCEQQPVSKCNPCGHQVCMNCVNVNDTSNRSICPSCHEPVVSIDAIKSGSDNQQEDSEEASVISPITLSLLSEMFESISLDELETVLKECRGQANVAIERILQTHVSFNPDVASASTSAGTPTISAAHPTQKNASHRSNSISLPTAGQASNWKTELCVYYLQGKCNKTRRTCSFAHGEADLARPSTITKPGSSAAVSAYKSRLCPLFLDGNCPKSRRDCLLAHGESDLRDANATSTPTLPTTTPRLQNYKTEMCYYYLKGCCNYTKEECRFAHGESDLRTVESNTLELSAQLNAAASGASAFDFGPSNKPATSLLVSAGHASSSALMEKQLLQQPPYQQPYHMSQQQPPSMLQQPSYQSQPAQFSAMTQAHQHQPQSLHSISYGHPASIQHPSAHHIAQHHQLQPQHVHHPSSMAMHAQPQAASSSLFHHVPPTSQPQPTSFRYMKTPSNALDEMHKQQQQQQSQSQQHARSSTLLMRPGAPRRESSWSAYDLPSDYYHRPDHS